tara:strand:+ start:668 stop:997 length:330 start_codon:yes stop_codon:yes gene_type:complete
MAIIAYIEVRNEGIKMSLNRNTVGWGCKLEALKDMGIKNSDYDTLVDTVSSIEHKVEVDHHDYGFEEAHVIGHGNSDGYKSGGYILPNSSELKKFVVINGALIYETTIV